LLDVIFTSLIAECGAHSMHHHTQSQQFLANFLSTDSSLNKVD